MPKLYLIDGMSIVFRSYHAMSQSGLTAADGEPTGAVFGFINIITALLDKEKPQNIAVVFDRKEPTFRHEKYPAYKANREAFPEDLVPQLSRIKEFLDYASIPRFEQAGFEADDIIGTLAKKAANENYDVVCLTSDKDFYQLVDDKIKLYKPSKQRGEDFEIVDIKGVAEKFGVAPLQVIDVLALIGDASDNIPGVKGIGEKTAIPLIQKYGSVENLYEHLDEIESKSVKSKLESSRNIAFLSKELVTIFLEVPLQEGIEDCKLKEPDYSKLDELFAGLGFRQIRLKWLERSQKKILYGETIDNVHSEKIIESEVAIEPEHKTISSGKFDYNMVSKKEIFLKMLDELNQASILSVDLETSSLDRLNCEIVGIALCAREGRAFYIPVYEDEPIIKIFLEGDANSDQDSLFNSNPQKEIPQSTNNSYRSKKLPISWILDKLNSLFLNPDISKCGQNIKFDAFILKRFGVDISPIIFDTMIASYLLDPDGQHNLDALSKKWLSYQPIPISSLIGEKKSKQLSMKDIDPEQISDYACEDADLAFKLKRKLRSELERENLMDLARNIEFPLIEVITQIESNGVAIDPVMLNEISAQIAIEAQTLAEKIFKEAGTDFNLESPKQLGYILFEKLGLPPVKKTKTGYSTDVSVLSVLATSYPIADDILEYRQLMKLKSTYVDALPKLIDRQTGRIHTTFNQTVTSTGRLSSTDPNLQNIPIRSELGREVRKAFVPQYEDWKILSADYSQIELRIMAYYCKDMQLKKAFRDGLDIHSATAAILFDVDLSKVDSNMRRVAKTVNFGIMYGLGSFGLSQRLGIGRNEAKEIIDNYFRKYPGIKNYIDETISSTRNKGYAETLRGRRRYFHDISSNNRNLRTAAERAAINLPIQGTAADMMKIAMIKVYKKMRAQGLRSLMILQIHDELVFEVHPQEVTDLTHLVTEEMETALPLGEIPVKVETGIGNNWYEAH